MAIALDSYGEPTVVDAVPFNQKSLWAVSGYEADASTAVEIKPAPGVGLSLYITKIVLGSEDSDCHPHIQDEDDNLIFGPIQTTVEGTHIVADFPRPLKVVQNKALELKAAAGGIIFVFIEGATARA